jgi:hypothetical protein
VGVYAKIIIFYKSLQNENKNLPLTDENFNQEDFTLLY